MFTIFQTFTLTRPENEHDFRQTWSVWVFQLRRLAPGTVARLYRDENVFFMSQLLLTDRAQWENVREHALDMQSYRDLLQFGTPAAAINSYELAVDNESTTSILDVDGLALDLFVEGQWTAIGFVDLMATQHEALAHYVRNEQERTASLEGRVFYRCLTIDDNARTRIETALRQEELIYCRLRLETSVNMMQLPLRIRELYACAAVSADQAGAPPDLPVMEQRWMIVGTPENLRARE